MLNIAYTRASVVLVIFHYCVLKISNLINTPLYSVTSVVVLFAIKLNISTRKGVT